MTKLDQLTYTPAQAGQLLGMTESAIRARIFRGQLPVQRWGRRLLIRRDDLLHILGEDKS